MNISVFTDKLLVPDNAMLRVALGEMFDLWMETRNYVFEVYPQATEEWNSPGAKYGWSFRIKDKKRAIIYLLPREGYFLVALVYSEKATKAALESDVSDEIKATIQSARVYAEGRGFRVEVKEQSMIKDIRTLIKIKIAN
jgi:hypothetical protein